MFIRFTRLFIVVPGLNPGKDKDDCVVLNYKLDCIIKKGNY